ncbi:hypothetical protein [Erythrobacter sp.]|uniref:hypothetical protein n=1 Tax=Erythrobacter sp. TaxID=1042 RepID=UPI0025EE6582|nr:hypothetical protein [Erythrobacter sp.]
MTSLPSRFVEDRALRDAARAVIEEDISRIRASLGQQGVASRVSSSVGSSISGRVRAGASDVLEQAKQQASDHRGVLAVLIGAIMLWLMRGPLLALMDGEEEDAQNDGKGEDAGADAGTGAEPARAPEGDLQ